jgi:C-terminal processing protease CtpA/Prc
MSNILKTSSWASLAACLTIALAAATAIAQQDESRQNDAQDQQQRSSDQQRSVSRDAERSASDQQSQRNQSGRNETSRDSDQWPNPQRYESDRDWRQTDRSRQGGLGVNIMSDDREGVVVQHVHDGSPAEEMGIRAGDRITAINGRKVESTQDFISRIRNMEPGEEVEFDFRRGRGGNEQTVSGELQSRKQALADHAQQADRYDQQDRWTSDSNRSSSERDRYSDSGPRFRDDSQQTSFNEQSGRSQADSNRVDQLERQIND